MHAMTRRRLVLACLLLAGMLFAACGTTTTPANSTTAPTGAGSTAGGSVTGRLTIAGSSALQPLVDHAAQVFQQNNRAAQITVSAGGSGAGRNQACQRTVDIGMSDVPLSDEEKTSLSCGDAVETVVAIQAFGVAANPTGPGAVKALTKEQLQGIFGGTITNWSEVGGDNQAIVVINRAAGSGTRAKMAAYLFDGEDARFATGAAEVDSSQTVVNNLRQTPGAVSYLGLAFLSNPGLTAFGIQNGSDLIEPTEANAASGKWPIGGPGYGITNGPPSELGQAFLDFMTGPEFAQDPIWQTLGFVPPGAGR